MTRRKAMSSMAVVTACLATPAYADTYTYTLDSEITILNGCAITASPMSFGIITGMTTQPTTTSSIVLQCNPNIDYIISIDNGQNANGFNRRMRNPVNGQFLRYRIYSNAGLSNRWDTRNNRRVAGNSGATGVVSHTAYGQITTANFASRSGAYYDTVTVSVEF